MSKNKFKSCALSLVLSLMASINLAVSAQCGNAANGKPQQRELKAQISKAQSSARAENWKRLESARTANSSSTNDRISSDDNFRQRFGEQLSGRRPPPPPWGGYGGAGMRQSGGRCSSCGHDSSGGMQNSDSERQPEGMNQQNGFRPPQGGFRPSQEGFRPPPPPHGFGPMEGMPPPPHGFGPDDRMPPPMQE